MVRHKVGRLEQNLRSENVKRSKANAKMILKMVTEKEGINLVGANLGEVFPSNLQELANKFFDREKISQDNLARYLFQESFIQARTAIKSGNKSFRAYINKMKFSKLSKHFVDTPGGTNATNKSNTAASCFNATQIRSSIFGPSATIYPRKYIAVNCLDASDK